MTAHTVTAHTMTMPDENERPRLLAIDDDEAFGRVLTRALEQRGYHTLLARNAADALTLARAEEPEYVVLDLNLAGDSGLRLIPPLLEANPQARIVVLTGYASITTAVDAVKLGAIQYLAKPAAVDAILHALHTGEAPGGSGLPGEPLTVSELEWEHLQRVLADNGGNISATARALRMHRRTLQRKLARRPGSPDTADTPAGP
jgi:two-component system, response regulator RegA